MKKYIIVILLFFNFISFALNNEMIISEIFERNDFVTKQTLYNQLSGDSTLLEFIEKAFAKKYNNAISDDFNINSSIDYFVLESIKRVKHFESCYNILKKYSKKRSITQPYSNDYFQITNRDIVNRLLNEKIDSAQDLLIASTDSILGIVDYLKMGLNDSLKFDSEQTSTLGYYSINPFLHSMNKISKSSRINEIARNNLNPIIKAAAIEFVTDTTILNEIIKNDSNLNVRMAVIMNRFYVDFDNMALLQAQDSKAFKFGTKDSLFNKMRKFNIDPSSYENETNPEFRKKRIYLTSDQLKLKELALREPDRGSAFSSLYSMIIDRITNESYLTDIFLYYSKEIDSLYLIKNKTKKEYDRINYLDRSSYSLPLNKITDQNTLSQLLKSVKSFDISADILRSNHFNDQNTVFKTLLKFMKNQNFDDYYTRYDNFNYTDKNYELRDCIAKVSDKKLIDTISLFFDVNKYIKISYKIDYGNFPNQYLNYLKYHTISSKNDRTAFIHNCIFAEKYLLELLKNEPDEELKKVIKTKLVSLKNQKEEIYQKVRKGESVSSTLLKNNYDSENRHDYCTLPYLDKEDFIWIAKNSKHDEDIVVALKYFDDQQLVKKLIYRNWQDRDFYMPLLTRLYDFNCLKELYESDHPNHFRKDVLSKIKNQDYLKNIVKNQQIEYLDFKEIALANIMDESFQEEIYNQYIPVKFSGRITDVVIKQIADTTRLFRMYSKADQPRKYNILKRLGEILKSSNDDKLKELIFKYQSEALLNYIDDLEFLKNNLKLFNRNLKKSVLHKLSEYAANCYYNFSQDFFASLLNDPIDEELLLLTLEDNIWDYGNYQKRLQQIYSQTSNQKLKQEIFNNFTNFETILEVIKNEKLRLTDEDKEKITSQLSSEYIENPVEMFPEINEIVNKEELHKYLFQNEFEILKELAYTKYEDILKTNIINNEIKQSMADKELQDIREKLIDSDSSQYMLAYFIQKNLIKDKKVLFESYSKAKQVLKLAIINQIDNQAYLNKLLQNEKNTDLCHKIVENIESEADLINYLPKTIDFKLREKIYWRLNNPIDLKKCLEIENDSFLRAVISFKIEILESPEGKNLDPFFKKWYERSIPISKEEINKQDEVIKNSYDLFIVDFSNNFKKCNPSPTYIEVPGFTCYVDTSYIEGNIMSERCKEYVIENFRPKVKDQVSLLFYENKMGTTYNAYNDDNGRLLQSFVTYCSFDSAKSLSINKALGENDRFCSNYKLLSKYIEYDFTDRDGFNFTGFPVVSSITFNTDFTLAIIQYRFIPYTNDNVYKKTDGKWQFFYESK